MAQYKKAEQVYIAAGAANSADHARLFGSMYAGDYARLLNDMGTNLINRGHYQEGMAQYKKAERLYLAVSIANTTDYADLLFDMGFNLINHGHDEEGMAKYKKAEQVYMAAGA